MLRKSHKNVIRRIKLLYIEGQGLCCSASLRYFFLYIEKLNITF